MNFNSDVGILTIRMSKSGKTRHVVLTDEGRAFFNTAVENKTKAAVIFTRVGDIRWGTNHQRRPLVDADNWPHHRRLGNNSGHGTANMTVALKPRWFRRWWFSVPVGVAFVLLAQANVLLSLPFFILLLAITWSGPIYRLGRNPMHMRKRDKLILTAICVAVIIVGLVRQGGDASMANGTANLPTCDSKIVISTFKQAIKNSPQGRTFGLEVYDLTQIIESGWEPSPQIRSCMATAPTNSGQRKVDCMLNWVDQRSGRFWIETGL